MFSKTVTGVCPVNKSRCTISIHLIPAVSNEGIREYAMGDFDCPHENYHGECKSRDSCPLRINANSLT